MFFDSGYQGEGDWISIRIPRSDLSLQLVRPTCPDDLLQDNRVAEWNRKHEYMPYWAYLWPGAALLSQAIVDRTWTEGLWALELGCGLGLAGLTALARGMNVHFTDHDAAPLHFVGRSIAANGFDPGRAKCSLLDWAEPPHEKYPVILGADLLYESRLVPLVAQVIDRMLAEDGRALLAGPKRAPTEGFAGAMCALGFRVECQPIQTSDWEGRPVRGQVHVVRRVRVD